MVKRTQKIRRQYVFDYFVGLVVKGYIINTTKI